MPSTTWTVSASELAKSPATQLVLKPFLLNRDVVGCDGSRLPFFVTVLPRVRNLKKGGGSFKKGGRAVDEGGVAIEQVVIKYVGDARDRMSETFQVCMRSGSTRSTKSVEHDFRDKDTCVLAMDFRAVTDASSSTFTLCLEVDRRETDPGASRTCSGEEQEEAHAAPCAPTLEAAPSLPRIETDLRASRSWDVEWGAHAAPGAPMPESAPPGLARSPPGDKSPLRVKNTFFDLPFPPLGKPQKIKTTGPRSTEEYWDPIVPSSMIWGEAAVTPGAPMPEGAPPGLAWSPPGEPGPNDDCSTSCRSDGAADYMSTPRCSSRCSATDETAFAGPCPARSPGWFGYPTSRGDLWPPMFMDYGGQVIVPAWPQYRHAAVPGTVAPQGVVAPREWCAPAGAPGERGCPGAASGWPSAIDPDLCRQLEDAEMRDRAHAAVRGQALRLAFDKGGCRDVQRALYAAWQAGGASLDALLEELLLDSPGRKIVPKMMESPHANHVVLRMLEVLLADARGPRAIAVQLEGKATHFASHRYGCRILVKLLEHGANRPECARVVDELQGQESVLRDHKFGSYVVEAMRKHYVGPA